MHQYCTQQYCTQQYCSPPWWLSAQELNEVRAREGQLLDELEAKEGALQQLRVEMEENVRAQQAEQVGLLDSTTALSHRKAVSLQYCVAVLMGHCASVPLYRSAVVLPCLWLPEGEERSGGCLRVHRLGQVWC